MGYERPYNTPGRGRALHELELALQSRLNRGRSGRIIQRQDRLQKDIGQLRKGFGEDA